MNEIKLICTDIDRTLLNDDKKINKYDKEMIRRAWNEKRIPFVLNSGRNRHGLKYLQEELDIPCGYSCFNGSYIEFGGVVLKDKRIELDVLRKLIPIIKENNSLPMLFNLDDSYQEYKEFWYYLLRKMFNKPGIIVNLEQQINEWEMIGYKPYKLLAKDLNEKNLIQTEKAIKSTNPKGVEIIYSSEHILEILPEGTDKGDAIDEISKHLNITGDNVMVFGDYENDIPAFKKAKYAIAMDNAIKEVKDIAYSITDSNNQSGIGKAIAKYIFNEK